MVKPTTSYNLVLFHMPRRQGIADFLTIRHMLAGKAPDISVHVVSLNQGIPKSFFAEISNKPTLFFSPMPVNLPFPARGTMVCPPQNVSKMEELGRLGKAQLPVPKSYLIDRFDDLVSVDIQPRVVIKPQRGFQGKGVKLIETSVLKSWSREQFEQSSSNDQGMIIQQYIDVGPTAISYRVMTVLGEVIYCNKSTANNAQGLSLSDLSHDGTAIASNSGDRTIVECNEADIVSLGRQIHRKLNLSPVLGIDIVRDVQTGKLYVLELNSCGWTWHLSSDYGQSHQRRYSLNLYEQFSALKTITDCLIQEVRENAI